MTRLLLLYGRFPECELRRRRGVGFQHHLYLPERVVIVRGVFETMQSAGVNSFNTVDRHLIEPSGQPCYAGPPPGSVKGIRHDLLISISRTTAIVSAGAGQRSPTSAGDFRMDDEQMTTHGRQASGQRGETRGGRHGIAGAWTTELWPLLHLREMVAAVADLTVRGTSEAVGFPPVREVRRCHPGHPSC